MSVRASILAVAAWGLTGCVGASRLIALPTTQVAAGTSAMEVAAVARAGALGLPVILAAATAEAQNGRCGDDTDCLRGEVCVGPRGSSIGLCVLAEEPAEPSPPAKPTARLPLPQERRCNPTEDLRWHGASFEEKELLYDACLYGPTNSPL